MDENTLLVSADVRKMALVVILLRAGLSLKPSDLKKVGRPAVLMAFLPATFEIEAFTLLAPPLLGLARAEAAVMGAVPPAVVVPRMVRLMDGRRGTDKGVPQPIMAGASCDDVYAIVLFTAFMGMAQGGGVRAAGFAAIPIAIVLGVLAGVAAGWFFSRFLGMAQGGGVRAAGFAAIVLGVLVGVAAGWFFPAFPRRWRRAARACAARKRPWRWPFCSPPPGTCWEQPSPFPACWR